MTGSTRLRADLNAAIAGAGRGLAAADRLCTACVDLLGVDGAAISLLHEGATRGTYGSSDGVSRQLDEYQFTFGEGPCLDAAAQSRAVLVPDLAADRHSSWPAFTDAVLQQGVRALFALPVTVASVPVGALDLFRYDTGPLPRELLTGGLFAAELAALPLLDLMTADVDWQAVGDGADLVDTGDGWEQLATLERVEVYQATGMMMEQLDVDAAEALVRLRARAFTIGQTASELALAVIERAVTFNSNSNRTDDTGYNQPTGSAP